MARLDGIPAGQRRIYELIHELRVATPPYNPNEWLGHLRELTDIGRPAVPALVTALERAQNGQGLLTLALRIIRDPRAVPALIHVIPRTYLFTSVWGFPVPDPGLRRWLDDHFWMGREKRDKTSATLYPAIVEAIAALEAITGHSEGHGPIEDYPRDQGAAEIERVQELRRQFATRWQAWWDLHSGEFLKPDDQAELEKARADQELMTLAGEAKYGPLFPAGPVARLGPPREIILQKQGLWDARAYIDFDTGRVCQHNEGWNAALPSPRDPPNDWLEAAGIDAQANQFFCGDPRYLFCRLVGIGIKVWKVPDSKWDTLDEEIRATPRRIDPGPTGPMSSFYNVDPASGAVECGRISATFLFITREGGRGIVRVIDSVDQGRAVTFRYRMFKGVAARKPALENQLAVTGSEPAEGAIKFGPEQEATLASPTRIGKDSALDLETGARRAQTIERYSSHMTPTRRDWLKQWGGDVITALGPNGRLCGLGGGDMVVLPVDNTAWDKFPAVKVAGFLARSAAEPNFPGMQFMTTNTASTLSLTWVIQTRDGGQGLLQLKGVTADSVEFRYKLTEKP